MRETEEPADFSATRHAANALPLPSPTEKELALVESGPIRKRALSLRAALANWRLARRFDLRALTSADVTLDSAARRVPACASCEDSCCRGPGTGISLRLADVARLVDAGLGWAIDTHARWTEEDYASDPTLKANEALDTQRRFPMVRRREDGTCVFLENDQRCAVHAIRPLCCRAFPYRLDASRRRVHFSGRCPSFRDGGDEADVTEMTASVLGLYNAKVRDLVVLTHGKRELEELGLTRYLPIID